MIMALAVSLLSICVGCRSSAVVDSAAVSASVVVASPLVASYGAAYGSDAAMQNRSIMINAPKQWYSQKLTGSELWQKAMQHAYKFHEPWMYMGTMKGEHYLMLYPFLGFREIYRITEHEYAITEPFELTTRSSNWREIPAFDYLGMRYPLEIEPPLFEQPKALVPIQIDLEPSADFAADVEGLFMQDVQIFAE